MAACFCSTRLQTALISHQENGMLTQLSARRVSAELLSGSRNVLPAHARGARLLTTVTPHHVTSATLPGSRVTVSLSRSGGYKGTSPGHPALCSCISPRSLSSVRSYATSNMSDIKIKVGDTIPQGTFTYIPWSAELEDHSACGIRTWSRLDCVDHARSDSCSLVYPCCHADGVRYATLDMAIVLPDLSSR